jgi:outer membrane protein OmpA-like peptidoglycan-associated protein
MLNCMDRRTLSGEAKSILDGDAMAVRQAQNRRVELRVTE